MKLKIFSLICSVLLLLYCIPLHAFALEIDIDDVVADKGEIVEFTVELSESVVVKSGGIEVTFDPDVLEVVSAEWSLSNAIMAHYDAEKKLGAFAYMTGTEISGVIFKLKCRVLDSANYDRSDVVLTLQLNDGNQNVIEVISNPGSITVECRHIDTEMIVSNDYLKNPATCTNKAEYYYHCSNCGVKLEESYEYGELLEHQFDQQIIDDDFLRSHATCSEKATYYYPCVCGLVGESYYSYGEFDNNAHSFGEFVIESLAGCDVEGVGYYECSDCGYKKEEAIPATGHDEVAHDAKAPTCTEIGWDAYVTCSKCDYTTYVEKSALGHDEVAHDAKAPTCTEIGWDAYVTCSKCDYTTYVEKSALGHDEVAHDAKAPTCTEIGWDAYVTCSKCDYTTYSEFVATGHLFGEWYESVAPSTSSVGEEKRDCSVCGFSETKEIPMLNTDATEIETDNETGDVTEVETNVETNVETETDKDVETGTDVDNDPDKDPDIETESQNESNVRDPDETELITDMETETSRIETTTEKVDNESNTNSSKESERETDDGEETKSQNVISSVLGGCQSTVGIGTFAIVFIAAFGFVSFRKKEKDI